MKPLLAIAVSFMIVGCSSQSETSNASQANKTPENDQETTRKNFLALNDELGPNDQLFSFDSSKDTVVFCTEGTKVLFPSDIFVDDKGNKVKGQVDVKIKECYSLSNIIAERLQTSEGDDMLETAGMVHLSATSGGNPVFIDEGKNYEIQIPTNGTNKAGMRLYNGNKRTDGIINWTMDPNEPNPLNSRSYREFSTVTDTQTIEYDIPQRPEELKGKYNTKVWIECALRKGIRIPKRKTMTQWKLEGSSKTLIEYFNENFRPTEPMKEAFFNKRYSPIYELHFDDDAKLEKVTVFRESKGEYDQVIANFIGGAPQLDLKEFNDPDVFQFHQLEFKPMHEIDFVAAEEMKKKGTYQTFLDKKVSNLSLMDLDYYILSPNRLGWINCDRSFPGRGNADMIVKVDQPKNTRVHLVFSDQRSIMMSNLTDRGHFFPGFRENAEATLVAIRTDGEHASMCKQKITIKDGEIELNNFKSFSFRELTTVIDNIQSGI